MMKHPGTQYISKLPAEFFLPPASNHALWSETRNLILGSLAFIAILSMVVALTQGIVVTL
ncbi:DUF7156 family protein [Mycobacterium sp.]|uniref:DUF7156 family protein n=1 Tax=Mycobacterium sp. TaxID=1785 RepID=UPI003F989008